MFFNFVFLVSSIKDIKKVIKKNVIDFLFNFTIKKLFIKNEYSNDNYVIKLLQNIVIEFWYGSAWNPNARSYTHLIN